MAEKRDIYTIGHSNRSIDEFLELLAAHGIEQLVDVRTIPRSKHNPQFNGENLSGSLRKHKIRYVHMKELGGLRHPKKDSVNQGWHNDSFRGYADYMQSSEFESALKALIHLGEEAPTAIMCAEAVPWRCHRSLIADALIVRGFAVKDIMTSASAKGHSLNPMAVVEGGSIMYPIDTRS